MFPTVSVVVPIYKVEKYLNRCENKMRLCANINIGKFFEKLNILREEVGNLPIPNE